jgi:diguanylate cyclase (GGDEF)-like protein
VLALEKQVRAALRRGALPPYDGPGQVSVAIAVWLIKCLIFIALPGRDAVSPWNEASAIHPKTVVIAIPYRPEWRTDRYVAEFGMHVDRVQLRYQDTAGARHVIRSGMLVPVADRPVHQAYPAIPIPRDALPGRPLELTITSEVEHPQLRFLSMDQLRNERAARMSWLDFPLLLFAGFFIALALANLALYASYRYRAYLAYAGVMLSAAFIAMRSSPDIFWAWLFPHASVPYVVVHDGSILAYSICLVAFTRGFLMTRKTIPGFDRFLVAMYFLFVAAEAIAHDLLSSVYLGTVELVDAIYISFLLVPFVAGILALRAGSEAARFYLIAFAGVYVCLLIMDTLGLFGHSYPLIIFFGIAWEGLWLMAALGVRIRRLDQAALDLAREQAVAALHDSLTGLANRRKIELDLQDALPPFAVVYLDIDHFSVINATAGHEEGDALLAAIAARLDGCVHPGDTLARSASDEFALLLKNRTVHGAQQTANELVASISRAPFQRDHQTLHVTASAGCLLVSKKSTPSLLIAMADDACHHAKEQGRHRVYVTTDDAAEETTQVALHWVRRTSDALRDDRLALFFQPIVSLHDPSEPPRAEILVRLLEEDGTIVEPAHFLGTAERFNLTASIDRWVIHRALPIVAPIVEAGKLGGVSINLSGNALQDPSLDQYIGAEIKTSGIRSSALTFEITETVVLAMLRHVRQLMATLRRQHVSFALDDFGTGTSSLGILRQLDVDFLKIDGAFVRDCATNPVDAAMLKTIRDLANALGLKTVAEYAKDSASVEKLREIGIDYAQGWAYAKPEPIEALASIDPVRYFGAAASG